MENFFRRKDIRLKGYDYSSEGLYFVTICTRGLENTLSEVVGEDNILPYGIRLSEVGGIVEASIARIPEIYPSICVDCYVIMPNHLHMIIGINLQGGRIISAPTISKVVGYFKQSVSKKCGGSIWQSSFQDRVIRDEAEYELLRKYIKGNPTNWKKDRYYNVGADTIRPNPVGEDTEGLKPFTPSPTSTKQRGSR